MSSDRNMRNLEVGGDFIIAVAGALCEVDVAADVGGVENALDSSDALFSIDGLFRRFMVDERCVRVEVIERYLAANVRATTALQVDGEGCARRPRNARRNGGRGRGSSRQHPSKRAGGSSG